MIFENEVTVEALMDFDNLKKLLEKNNFKIMEVYDVNDIYLLNNSIKKDNDYLNLLKNCVLIRNIIDRDGEHKKITYKYKEYNNKKEIVKQGKVNCSINHVEEAIQLLEALNYKEIIRIYDHLTVFSNGDDELVVQQVNNRHIYIEIEEKGNYTDKEYQNIEEMKEVFKKYNIPIKNDDFFVSKAEREMKEVFDN